MDQGDSDQHVPEVSVEAAWEAEKSRQDNELIKWIDEFLESDEYVSILSRKVRNAKLTQIKNVQSNTIYSTKRKYVPSGNEEMETTSIKLSELDSKLQMSLRKQKICNTIANQCKGIEIIRKKIYECKYRHYEQEQIEKTRELNDKRKAISCLRKDFSVNMPCEELSSKIFKAIRKKNLERYRKVNNMERNNVRIVRKLVGEMKRDQQIKRNLDKHRQLPTKKETTTQPEVVNSSTIIDEYYEDEISFDTMDEEEEEEAEEGEQDIKVKQKSLKKSAKEVGSSSTGAESKDSGKKKGQDKKAAPKKSIDKSSKKVAKKEEDVIPEVIPVVNPRKKILPSYMLDELLEDFNKLYAYIKDKEAYELQLRLGEKINLLYENGFFTNPNKIIFKDFETGKIYRKTISIVNGNAFSKDIHYERIIWNSDIEEDMLLDVEPFGVSRVLPGMSTRICLRFAPEILNKTIAGQIIFITRKPKSQHRYQFVLNVVCVPLCAAVTITPTIISFDELPIWRARLDKQLGKNYKTVKVSNSGLKACKVVVTKIFNMQTIEQEWKKIISIIRMDDDNSETMPISSSNINDPDVADPFPKDLVQQCVENVFNVFKFERNIFMVEPKTTKVLKCWFNDISDVGYHVESYTFSIYERFVDGNLYCIGTQNVIINSETTEHFLNASVEILDFEVCVYGSAYQLDFDVTNPCKLPHHVRICFPSIMKNYLQANTGVATILPKESLKVFIKFLPQNGILVGNKFYDPELCLLEFPIYVKVVTKDHEDTPPLKIHTYAVVTDPKQVILSPGDCSQMCFEADEHILDMGDCTTMESIYTDIQIQNNSIAPQQFGFINLPKYASLEPNYGFGKLQPMQKTKLRLLISANKLDLVNLEDGSLKFQLVLSTIKQCGAIKKKFRTVDLVKKLKAMEEYVCRSQGSSTAQLKEDIDELRDAVRRNTIEIDMNEESNHSVERLLQVLDSNEKLVNVVKYDMEEEKAIPETLTNDQIAIEFTQVLNIRVHVINCTVEFSHQIVNFPDTPCGSYSFMTVDLIAHKVRNFKYSVTFEISGGNEEFEVQPSYGSLSSNSKTQICFIVKPTVPQAVLEKRARMLKVSELLMQRQEEQELEIDKDKGTTVTKEKKGKADEKAAKKNMNKVKDVANITVDNVKITPEDYYQAEINVWRSIEPTFLIENLFTCKVTYKDSDGLILERPIDEMFVKASCQVGQPSFIHDQKYQVLDFGCVAVGMSATKNIKFQNIQRRRITINASPTNPVGAFSSTAQEHTSVPSEFILNYPIKFAPTKEQYELEFLDISSEYTSYPFIMRGIGIAPNLVYNPNFVISRITASPGGYGDCSFDIKNVSTARVEIFIEKLCELQGEMKTPETQQTDVKNKKGKSPGSSAGKKQKLAKFSNQLDSDEVYSLPNFFELRNGSAIFNLVSNNEQEVFSIEPNGKCPITIRFGISSPSSKDGENKKGKNKAAKASKSDEQKSEISLNSQKGVKPVVDKTKYFVAKYNLYIGRETFLRDIIIIGNFN